MDIVHTPAYNHEKVADEPIDSVGIPRPDSFAHDQVPLVVNHEGSDRPSPLQRISALHGRSYLLDYRPEGGQPWVDQYGNPYNAITSKGNNLTQHRLIRSATAPSGYLPYGLQEGDALLRVAVASRVMRAAGVDTERTIGVFQPLELAYEGERVPVPDYKRLVVENMVRQIKAGRDNRDFSLEEVAAAATELDRMDFFVTLRAMSTAARIGDLLTEEPQDTGSKWVKDLHYGNIGQIFRDYNALASARPGLLRDLGLSPQMPTEVSVDTDRHIIEHYFSEILPKLMATNMGLMHSAGLLHIFPHTNNFTGLGGIVDLDSVRGERLQLGDELDEEVPLLEQCIEEKTGVSHEALAQFRRYEGHGIDWQAVSRRARENFTQVYIDTYDGSMTPSDRMKSIFFDAAVYRPRIFRDGSPLEASSLERFYPGANAAIDAVETIVAAALTERFLIRTPDYAWLVLDSTRDPYSVWGMEEVTKPETDENGEPLLNLGLSPTDQEILDVLPVLYEANEENGELYSHASHMIGLLPLLKIRILSDLKNELGVDIAKEFLARLPNSEGVDIEEVRDSLGVIEHEVLKRIEEKAEKPDFDEFWGVARTVFKERILDTLDRSIVPENDYVHVGDIDIEKYVAFWEFNRGEPAPIIEHVCSGLSSAQIAAMIGHRPTKPISVTTADEVLQIEPDEGEEVRLLITDGVINTVMHYKDYGGEFEDINYQQYRRSDGSVPTGATEAVFLLQKFKGSFRLVHKKLQ